MKAANPYLDFPGNTEPAFTFHQWMLDYTGEVIFTAGQGG